jgi:hypothetical protein
MRNLTLKLAQLLHQCFDGINSLLNFFLTTFLINENKRGLPDSSVLGLMLVDIK